VIFGVGTDLLRVDRIEGTLARFGQRFVDRLLLPDERDGYERTRRKVRYLAMRFAAKEALVKAMGTGFGHGMWIRDVGVAANDWGKPEVIWSARGERLRRQMGIGDAHVSLTDEAGLVVAFAVLLREPSQ
jgi:holo-[acyl-carrier protein] synthase